MRAVAFFALMTLVVAGCGSRLPEDVLAQIDARGPAAGAPLAAGGQQVPGGGDDDFGFDPVTGDDLGGGDQGGGGAATGGGGGGGGGQDQAGGGGSGTAGASGPCRPLPSDRGVTNTEIKVATMMSESGPLPGATEGQFRGTAAYFAKVNAAGGICGRRVTVLKGDDGLDPQRGRAEFTRLEPQVVAFVGSLAVADSGYLDLIRRTGVPYIGTMTDPAGRELPSALPKQHPNQGHTGPWVYYRQRYPEARRVGFIYADIGGVRANTPSSREPMKRAGLQIAYDSGVNVASPDYTAEVINLRNANVQLLYFFAVEVNMHVRFARNMRQQNWDPPIKVANIGYNSKLVELLGPLAEGWANHLTHQPVLNPDEPGRNPVVADFLKWNRDLFRGGSIDLFVVNGWRDAALFHRALVMMGGEVTRAKIIDVIDNHIPEDDGGGIFQRYGPSTGTNSGCFIIARVRSGQWSREHPAQGYECGLGQMVRY